MELTDKHIEAIKAAALPIDYGSITIQIGEAFNFLEIDVHHKLRIDKKTEAEKIRKNKNNA